MNQQDNSDDQPCTHQMNPFHKLTDEEFRELFKHVEDPEEE